MNYYQLLADSGFGIRMTSAKIEMTTTTGTKPKNAGL